MATSTEGEEALPEGTFRSPDADPADVRRLAALLARAANRTLEAAPSDGALEAAPMADALTLALRAVGQGCRLASPSVDIYGVTNDAGDLITRCLHTARQNNGPHEWDATNKRIR